ncbi:MAG: phosphatidylglycerol lysyltransferase domain-containing protein [Oscillospiraceae bacterium]|nr:phosphatidylglycerol lysyltransferase domain-containing protein [Oscillospiraceae bacterium]
MIKPVAVTIKDKERFELCRDAFYKSLGHGNYISDLCFSNLLAWGESIKTRRVFAGRFCCVSVEFAGKLYRYAPLGPLDPLELYENFIEEFYAVKEEKGEKIELIMIPEALLPALRKLNNFTAEYSYDEAYSDYLYENASFLNLLDNASNRYDYNYFVRNHAPYFRLIDGSTKADCLKIMDKFWCSRRDCGDCHFGCERKALQSALTHFDALDLSGALVYAGREPAAFVVAKHLNPEVIAYSFLKSDRHMRGLQVFLLVSFAREVHKEAEKINFTEDMGVAGLRLFKRRLAPFTQIHKYNIILTRTH